MTSQTERTGGSVLVEPYHETFAAQDRPRDHYRLMQERLVALGLPELKRLQQAADLSFLRQGITFTVYGEAEGTERIFPFDILPRLVTAEEWDVLERGLDQRITALNLFLDDIYHRGQILDDGVVPAELIYSCKHYRPEMKGVRVPGNVYLTVVGSDLVRLPNGRFAVLEDNLRVPSGVSYMLANRQVMKRVFPSMFNDYAVRSIDQYAQWLLTALRELAPDGRENASAALLTPGVYNSAYFEHAFLARQMGIPLVEGRDLVVIDDRVYQRTTAGLKPIEIIYRRIDDDFIDPVVFRADSQLGVPGIMQAYRKGNVTLANALGTGVADDKAIYAYVPDIIRYYLKQDPIIDNIETYILAREQDRMHVLDRLPELVVKAVGEAGGYGMLIGPHATAVQIDEFRGKILENPRNYIAQPTLSLSVGSCFLEDGFQARHIDLRVYVLYGKRARIVPGGLTRVALRRGSLVVNSSQGGGSKDTWVLSNGDVI